MDKTKSKPDLMKLIVGLKKMGLFKNRMIKARAEHAIQTGNVSFLMSYLNSNKRLVEQAKAMQATDPFHPRPTDEDFKGQIPLSYVKDPLTGENAATFRVAPQDLTDYMLLLGRPGSGKTNATLVMISSIMEALGDSVRFWIFEPKRTYRYHLHPEFVTLQFTDFIDQVFEPPTKNISPVDWSDHAIDLLATELYFQVASKSQLQDIIARFRENSRIPFPKHWDVLKRLWELKKIVKAGRDRTAIETLENRFKSLTNFEKKSQSVKLPIRELADRNIVFELGTEDFAEIKLLRAALLIDKLFMFKTYNPEERDRMPINIIVIEEARRIFGHRSPDFGESILETDFTLAREMGIGFIVVTHEPSSISKVVRSNVYTTIAFPLSDGNELKAVAQANLLDKDQFKHYLGIAEEGRGNALVRYGGLGRPFPVTFPFYGKPDRTILMQAFEDNKNAFIERFRCHRPQPLFDILDGKPETKVRDEAFPESAMKLLSTIYDSPFINGTELRSSQDMSDNAYSNAKAHLIQEGFIEVQKIKIRKGAGSNPQFYEITDAGFKALGKKKLWSGKESLKHRVYKKLVWDCLVKELDYQDFTLEEVSASVGSRHRFDIFSQDTGEAFEITLSFANLTSNIVQGFNDPRVKRLIIIADTEKDMEKCKEIAALEIDKFGDMLTFKVIADYFI